MEETTTNPEDLEKRSTPKYIEANLEDIDEDNKAIVGMESKLEKNDDKFKYSWTKNKNIVDYEYVLDPKLCAHIHSADSSNITVLNLSNCQLSSIPSDFDKLSFLVDINLSHNNLKVVPSCALQIEEIKRINLSHNRLKTFEQPLCVKQLRHLNISHNLFVELPHWFQRVRCYNLEEFDYSCNLMNESKYSEYWRLTYFRLSKYVSQSSHVLEDDFKFFKSIHTLKCLDISNVSDLKTKHKNSFLNIEKLFVNAEWANNLVELNLSNLSLSILGEEISNVGNLEKLLLGNNSLSWLPKGIGVLQKLKCLDISNNKIDCVPEFVQNLTALEEFYLSSNYANAVPNLTNLKNLFVLDLYDNEIYTDMTDAVPETTLLDFDYNYVDTKGKTDYELKRDKLRLKLKQIDRVVGLKRLKDDDLTHFDYHQITSDEDEDMEKSCNVREHCSTVHNEQEECWDVPSESIVADKKIDNSDKNYPSSDEDWCLPDNFDFRLT